MSTVYTVQRIKIFSLCGAKKSQNVKYAKYYYLKKKNKEYNVNIHIPIVNKNTFLFCMQKLFSDGAKKMRSCKVDGMGGRMNSNFHIS